MSREQLIAALKAAFFGLVALIGQREAENIARGIINDSNDDSWSGPGGR